MGLLLESGHVHKLYSVGAVAAMLVLLGSGCKCLACCHGLARPHQILLHQDVVVFVSEFAGFLGVSLVTV